MSHLREHPTDGARIVGDLCPREIVEAVQYHHELFDGSGYPDGLEGEQIPLIARIVGVADFYEALCEDRSYRPARERLESLELISAEADANRLDPNIVAALLKTV
jgi:HD-GYP domain-containing protein (c-di-GMP phosphodiesterase class II)